MADLGAIQFLKETIEKNPSSKDSIEPLIGVLEACKDITVTDLSEAIQSFGQSANAQAEKLVSGVELSEVYENLKDKTDGK